MEQRLAQDDIGPKTVAALMHRPVQSGVNCSADLYDFSRAGDIVEPQMKAIDRSNASFAAKLQGALSGWLRTELAVTPSSSRQTVYFESSGERFERAYLFSVRVEPLGARALLGLDMSVAVPIFELLLGGDGGSVSSSEPAGRELTEIEEEILQSMTYRISRELNAAWRRIGLWFEDEQRESAEHVMKPTASVLRCDFEIAMRDARGELRLYLPTAGLNSLVRQALAETTWRSPTLRSGEHLIARATNLRAERE